MGTKKVSNKATKKATSTDITTAIANRLTALVNDPQTVLYEKQQEAVSTVIYAALSETLSRLEHNGVHINGHIYGVTWPAVIDATIRVFGEYEDLMNDTDGEDEDVCPDCGGLISEHTDTDSAVN